MPPEVLPHLERIEAECLECQVRSLPADFARRAMAGGAALGGAFLTWVGSEEAPTLNRCVGLGVRQPATQASLEEVLRIYRQAGSRKTYIQVSPQARPAELETWLAARGIPHFNNWNKLYRDVTPPPAVACELRVEEVGTNEADRFAEVALAAYGMSAGLAPMLASPTADGRWHGYLAFDGSTPVAAAGLFVSGEAGWLGVGATLPTARCRGAQSALIARRIQDARRLGCRWLVSETAQDPPEKQGPSFRNLARLGFRLAYVRKNYLWTRQAWD